MTTPLTDWITLVAGGAGAVGEGITRALLERGATVVVPSRTPDRLDALARHIGPQADGRLVPLVGDIGRPDGAEAIRDAVLGRFGRLDAAVASIGRWWQGEPLTRVPFDLWQMLLDDMLTAHFVAARTLVPALTRPGGSYTFIAGFSREAPYPMAGPISVTGAAQAMLMRQLAAEERLARPDASRARINELVLGPINTRERPLHRPGWLSADDVGGVVALVADPQAAIDGQTLRLLERADLAAVVGRPDLADPGLA